MAITRSDVETIAALARLRLEPGEADRMAAQLSGILDHVDELREADIDDVPAFSVAAADVAPPRRDTTGTDPLQQSPEQIAPAWVDGFFTVPRLAAHRTGDDADAS